MLRDPVSAVFPYTTLFRSGRRLAFRPRLEEFEPRLVPSDNAQFVSELPASGTSVTAGAAFTGTVTQTNKVNTTLSPGARGDTLNRNPQGTDPIQQGRIYYA